MGSGFVPLGVLSGKSSKVMGGHGRRNEMDQVLGLQFRLSQVLRRQSLGVEIAVGLVCNCFFVLR